MDTNIPKRRKGGSFSAIVGVALSAFLLGALVVGYMSWDGEYAFMSDGAADEPAAAVDVEPAKLTANEVSPTPTATATEVVEQAAEEATEAVERVEDKQGGLDQRLAAAEQRLDRLVLQAEAASGNTGRAEGLLIAFAARRTLEKGEKLGYLTDELRLRFGVAQPQAVALLAEASENPIRLDKLIARLDGLGTKLVTVEEGPSLARLRRELGQLFVIRSEATASPQPDRALARARLALSVGRVDSAIEEVEKLPGASNAKQWIEDARRYSAIQGALDVLEISAVKESSQLRDREGRSIEQASPAEGDGI